MATTMTKKQQATLDRAIDACTMHGHYEVKELDIEPTGYNSSIKVNLTTGLVKDEGTLAECICRDSYAFLIGAQGGIYHYTDRGNKEYLKPYELLGISY